jgi:signal transduction histidine kinase
MKVEGLSADVNNFLWIITFISLGLAAWFAWRYFDLRRNVDQVTRYLRDTKNQLPASKEIDELVSVIESRRTTFTAEMTNLRNEKERLATLLEQLTDGVLIADADGRVQFANPAALKLFSVRHPINQTVAQVMRNHQLIEAWMRCQQTRQLQIESVELPTRRQFLQLIAIPDEHEGGSLLLGHDLTQVRKLYAVRRDFISNVSH